MKDDMHVAKWGNSLAVRLPAAVVDGLRLKAGDDITIRIVGDRIFEIERDARHEEALQRIRALRKPLLPGWRFDRDDANLR